jgi:hypothetical protein
MTKSTPPRQQAWEYCALVSHASADPDSAGRWLCRVSYFTPDGVLTRQLKDEDQPTPTDAFERAMAELGAGGWELVSLHHELVRNNINVAGEEFLATVHTGYSYSPFGVAYFKRTVADGRPIDEPEIRMPVS